MHVVYWVIVELSAEDAALAREVFGDAPSPVLALLCRAGFRVKRAIRL